MTLLKSKDEVLWQRCKWMFDGNCRFLDGEENQSQKVAFCSFPRSGNTFMRKYLELLTGIQTGSDNTLHVNVCLQMQGLKGEHIVDDTVWIVKSHSPWIMPESPLFTANKVVVVVRNPLDCIPSFLSLCSMGNHSQKPPFNYEEKYPNFWAWWVRFCGGHINQWFKHLMTESKFRDAPMLFVRFEDLLMNPELRSMMSFLLGERDLAGTNAERRIKEVIALGKKATRTYTLKENTTRLNGNFHRYTQD